jgi:prepilin-type N-terminal cleavage/methylation domain-containing protein
MQSKRGFTLMEMLVVIAIIALLVSLVLPALGRARRSAQSSKDGVQQKEIHRSFLAWANNNNGLLPIPGQINRLPVAGLGDQPGRGPEDFSLNTSQSLYSVMLAQEYFSAELLIGPTEVNTALVKPYVDYDFSMYDPGSDTYWDPGLSMNIAGEPGQGLCNASYTHEAICGVRKARRWRDTQDSTFPILGTRAVWRGLPPGDNRHNRSPTLRLHGPKNKWIGNIIFADNHLETLENFYPVQTTYQPDDGSGAVLKDNIFNYEFPYDPDGRAAPDAWLVIATIASDDGNTVDEQYDQVPN